MKILGKFVGGALVLVLALAGLTQLLTASTGAQEPPAGVTREANPAPAPLAVAALGRLEPQDGVRHVSGPSLQSVVVRDLLVDRGDRVTKGQLLAVLDTADLQAAVVKEREAELANARREYDRSLQLSRSQVESDSRRDEWRTKVSVLNRKAGNLRASQLLLGHTKLESTARYLGVELDDAFASRKRSKSNIFECSLPLAVMYVGPHVTHSAPHRLSTLRLRDSCSRSKAEGDCYV